jgi:phospholipid/cholesterol/gamma-HCH transport system substrate-binding protein
VLARETADITTGIRPGFVSSVKELRQVATNLNQGRDEIDRALQILPIKLTKIGRTAAYGSWFNFYLCEFHAEVHIPDALAAAKPLLGNGVRVNYQLPESSRCNLR